MTGTNFNREVGQAVMGDVNEAARFNNSNVMHVNLGPHEDNRPITELQRRRIAQKVRQVVEMTNILQLDVYTDILTELGAAKINELPRSRFGAAMAILDNLLSDGTGAAPAPPAQVAPTPVIVQRPASSGPWILSAAAVAIAGWLFLDKTMAGQAAEHCHLDGKTYSVGGAARMQDGVIRTCTPNTSGDGLHWVAAKKTSTPTKR